MFDSTIHFNGNWIFLVPATVAATAIVMRFMIAVFDYRHIHARNMSDLFKTFKRDVHKVLRINDERKIHERIKQVAKEIIFTDPVFKDLSKKHKRDLQLRCRDFLSDDTPLTTEEINSIIDFGV